MAVRKSGILGRRREARQGQTRYRGTGIWWGYVVALLALAAVVALVVQNGRDVRFEWLWWDFSTSLAVMILVTAFVSMGATSLVGLLWRRHRRGVLSRATAEAGGRGAPGEDGEDDNGGR